MTNSPHRYSLSSIFNSWLALPLWVQIWVAGILMPVNAYAFFILDTPIGLYAAIAAAFVVATNFPIMIIEGGMSRLMAIPHLIAWFPLSIIILLRISDTGFTTEGNVESLEMAYAIILLTINGVSLAFDSIDSYKWFKGERDIPGH